MPMNREFLEALYEEARVAKGHLEDVSKQTLTIPADTPTRRVAVLESDDRSKMLEHLLDLYWETHNGAVK